MILNFAACVLARIDGKSPVDYLDAARQEAVRSLSKSLLIDPPTNWAETLGRCAAELQAVSRREAHS
jgi:5-methylthioribose kinase